MPLSYYTDSIQTVDAKGYLKVCPRAEVRLYNEQPTLRGSAPPEGELALQYDADGSNERPAVLGADAFGNVSAWLETSAYWAASKCCDEWADKQVCVGCPAGPAGPAGAIGPAGPAGANGPAGPAGEDGRDAPCFTRNGIEVDPDGDCIELCDACPEPPCSATASDSEGLVLTPGETLSVNIAALVSGDPNVTIAMRENTASGLYVASFDGTTVGLRADSTACNFSIDYDVSCDNQVVAVGTLSGKLASGSKIYGASLMDVTDLDNAATGPLPAGSEFATDWFCDVNYAGLNTYPAQFGTEVAVMEGRFIGGPVIDGGPIVDQVPFPGDRDHGIPAYIRWIYGNGNDTGAPYNLCHKRITGIIPGQLYVIVIYFSNAIRPDSHFGTKPESQIRIDGVDVGGPVPVEYHDVAHNGEDRWERHEVLWTAPAGVTSVDLAFYDSAIGTDGDDIAAVPIGMQPVTVCP